jgi:hypothetical protein
MSRSMETNPANLQAERVSREMGFDGFQNGSSQRNGFRWVEESVK